MNSYIVAITIVIHSQHRNLGEHRVGYNQGQGGEGEVRKGFPEEVTTKLSPEEKAKIGQAKRWLAFCSANNICQRPEQKKAKRDHVEMNQHIRTPSPFIIYLSLHLFI